MGKSKLTQPPALALTSTSAPAITEGKAFVRAGYPELEKLRVALKGGRKAKASARAKSKAARKARRKSRAS